MVPADKAAKMQNPSAGDDFKQNGGVNGAKTEASESSLQSRSIWHRTVAYVKEFRNDLMDATPTIGKSDSELREYFEKIDTNGMSVSCD